MFSQFWSVKKYCIEIHNKYFSILVKKKHSSEFKIRDLIWWACYGFQKYLVKTPENENVPSERPSIHCATQETKPLMWLIFPRMIHKSKIKKNRFNGHLHLFFVDLQISYPFNIFLFRENYYQMWVWPPICIIVLFWSRAIQKNVPNYDTKPRVLEWI